MQTVYEIGLLSFDKSVGTTPLFFILGLGCLLVALKSKKIKHRKFLLAWGAVATISGVLFTGAKLSEHFYTYYHFKTGGYQVIEGVVTVLREQPKDGHAPGDLIEVGGVQLIVDYYKKSPGYRVTISNGSVLNDSARVKLYVRDGSILKIQYVN